MIPKKIHYCWFGGKELPELAVHCIESWKKFCPDYEIIRWDETNTDLEENDYIKEAFNAQKWAFITDYVRLNVLYKYGGIYMDTDVEVTKSLDQFLMDKAFSGFENATQIPTGIMASESGHPFFGKLLEYYKDRHFLHEDGTMDLTTNVLTITNIATANGFIPNNKKQTVCEMVFYPNDFFCPKDYVTGIAHVTENTACIHHFNGSWQTEEEKELVSIRRKFINLLGSKVGTFIYKIYKNVRNPKCMVNKLGHFSKIWKN